MSVNSIINTIHFIEENYARKISVNEIESISCYSYRNFQRIFKSACNESIGLFQKRLKLENAYKMLLFNKNTIKEIALEVGFESASALTKSFKQQFGFPPSEIRFHKKLIFKKNSILENSLQDKIDFEIVYMPKQYVYFSRIITSYESQEIEMHWLNFLKMRFPMGTKFFGIILDETIITEEEKCRYDACSSLQSLQNELPKKEIFGGRYAKFMHIGSYNTLHETYNKIYAQWMMQSDLTFSNLPPIEFYEIEDKLGLNNITSIYIPLM